MNQKIQSSRAFLRRLELNDLPMMLEMEGDNETMKYTSVGQALAPEEIKSRLIKSLEEQKNHEPFGVWAAVDIKTHDFIGWFMLRQHRSPEYEVGYMLRKKYWGQGLATEIVKSLVDFGFHKMGLLRIQALTDIENMASQKVLLKVGFEFKEVTEVETKKGTEKLKLFFIYKP